MIRIAIFASGSGSNAEKISEYFAEKPNVEISLILTNNPLAGVIMRARKLHIPVVIFDKKTFYDTDRILQLLQNEKTDFIVLAGFMMLIPDFLVKAYPEKIVNIHPALLPKHGGKGMYGHFVHEAVVAAKETESGITIHFVNERYDEGNIISQITCEVSATDTPDDVAKKVQVLEHENYPKVIEEVITKIKTD
ncbi:phosphoribosylglycinamide formyltransferase [Dyadobacter sp. NIV53]|uniref:phosphoribosylglycinamide formyltransferase n=1 Tax=Dyadobacter sp. NIV53 TaxID=2861765 RepID=UPI001C86C6BD|nr:phosphoribosylglycinamide formyltransferase [Dyadobacter sp. NIV53]